MPRPTPPPRPPADAPPNSLILGLRAAGLLDSGNRTEIREPTPAETLMAKIIDAGMITTVESGYLILTGGAIDVTRDEAMWAAGRAAGYSHDQATGQVGG